MAAAESAEALRNRHTDLTRRLIIDALADLVVEEGVHGFSIGAVAERAGVSERTVYNHFPNRQALLDGLAGVMDEEFRRRELPEPATLDELRTAMPRVFAVLGEMERMVQAYVMLTIGARIRARARQERTRRVEAILRRELADRVDEATLPAVTGLVRVLFSATAFDQLVHEHGVAPEEAGRAVGWVLDLVLDELAAGRAPRIRDVHDRYHENDAHDTEGDRT